MLTLIFPIARTTFLEAVRQPIYALMIAIAGLLQAFNTSSTGYSLGYTETGEVSGDNKLLLEISLATVFGCGTLLAGFIATAAISREIERKTILTVVSKPVPRAAIIIGKYLGIAGALLLAVLTMIFFLQLGIRHGVLSTARDEVDTVTVAFGLAAVAISVFVGTWGNFMYGWHFGQTASLLLCPLMFLAWVFMLLLDKDWHWQNPSRDFKPQILVACIGMSLALMVLAGIATAASTRLGQVMTIVVCFGAFVIGLLSNHLIGRRVYQPDLIGQILTAKPERDTRASFAEMGDIYFITLKSTSNRAIKAGDPFLYGPSPEGIGMPFPAFAPFEGDIADESTYFKPGSPGALVITRATTRQLTVQNVGANPVRVERPPQKDDYLFGAPTRLNVPALLAWGMTPNMQFFWLSDAVTQNRPVPAGHLGLVTVYSLVQLTTYLSLAVLLFQRREVG
ncbi:MAG: ABC transporter permease [Phycisphaerales bacterium]